MPEKEVKIGENTIGESTKISLSVKTAIWLISGIIALFASLFSLAYFDIKSELKDYKAKAEKDKLETIKAFETKVDDKLKEFSEADKDFATAMGDIKGDIKVILDRTANIRSNSNINDNNAPPK